MGMDRLMGLLYYKEEEEKKGGEGRIMSKVRYADGKRERERDR